MKYFLFPGAGSFGTEFRALTETLAPDAQLVRYPGRFGRDFGKSAGSFADLVRSCADQVRHSDSAILVGHSFGAYLAYAVAAQPDTSVAAVAVAGANAPGLAEVPPEVTSDRRALAAYLGPDLAGSGDWTDVVLDTATQDLRLLREFVPAEYPPLDCPVHAAHGETDPLTSLPGVHAWQHVTSGQVSVRTFGGGHSELLRTTAFATWLREKTASAQPLPEGV